MLRLLAIVFALAFMSVPLSGCTECSDECKDSCRMAGCGCTDETETQCECSCQSLADPGEPNQSFTMSVAPCSEWGENVPGCL